MPTLHLTEFTDPACPWAFSAEPMRRRLRWLYGDQISWDVRAVVLADSPEAYERRGFTLDMQEWAYGHIAREHGMPISAHRRRRMVATRPACRAVVAARLNAGAEAARAVCRHIAVAHFEGALMDDGETLAAAATAAGVDPADLARWSTDPTTEEALDADAAAARAPSAAALAQPERLSPAEDGRPRYTCPSYEFVRVADGATMSVPGFQQVRGYEIAVANLAPDLERRQDPTDPLEVLRWCSEPLSTREVAEVMNVAPEKAREALEAAGAALRPVAGDGYWSAP